MVVFLNVLENIISMLVYSLHFIQLLAIPSADDFKIICSRELFLLIYPKLV